MQIRQSLTKRLLASILTLAVVFGMMPMMTMEVEASGDPKTLETILGEISTAYDEDYTMFNLYEVDHNTKPVAQARLKSICDAWLSENSYSGITVEIIDANEYSYYEFTPAQDGSDGEYGFNIKLTRESESSTSTDNFNISILAKADIDGYVFDAGQTMAYKYVDDYIDVHGLFNGDWKAVTYSNEGFRTILKKDDTFSDVVADGTTQTVDGLDIKITASPDDGGETIKITYEVTNNGSSEQTFSLATGADVKIGYDDSATVRSFAKGFIMTSTVESYDQDSNDDFAQFNAFLKGAEGVTDVDALWYGDYYDEYTELGEVVEDGDYYWDDEECYFFSNPTNLPAGTDSVAAWHWADREIAAGATQTYSIKLGIGGEGSENVVASPTGITTWDALKTAMTNGGSIVLGGDITADAADTYLEVPLNKTVTLDLAGYTIDRNLDIATANGNVIDVNGTLTINDSSVGKTGTITGGYNTSNGGGIIVNGTLTMDGGTITDNKLPSNIVNSGGGGVYVANGATFTMDNGSITGNEVSSASNSGGGILVADGAMFTMNGGSITQNKAKSFAVGAGISIAGTFNFFGGSITDNTTEHSDGNSGISVGYNSKLNLKGNINLSGNAYGYPQVSEGGNINVSSFNVEKIKITGALDENAKIHLLPYIFDDGDPLEITGADGVVAKNYIDNFILENDDEYYIGTKADSDSIWIEKLANKDDSDVNPLTPPSGDSDQTAVATAKGLIEGGTYTFTQATANTEETAKAEIAKQINAMTGMSDTGVTVNTEDITISTFIAATGGTNGNFSFTVSLEKGNATATTSSKSATITATENPTMTDAEKLAADEVLMKSALGNITVTNSTTAQDILDALNGADTNGTTAVWADSLSGFTKQEATTSATGSITGTLNLTLNGETSTINVNITIAQLSEQTYTITVNHGTTSHATAAQGTEVTITATVLRGERFTNWTVDSGDVTLDNANSASTTFEMGTQAVEVTANFEPLSSAVTGVTVSPNAVTVQKGHTQQFYASVQGENNPAQTIDWTIEGTANAGTTIADGLLTVAADETAETLTVKATSTADNAISGTVTVTLSDVAVAMYTITPDTTVNGTISPSNAIQVSEGGSVTFTFTPDSGYEIDTVTVDGSEVTPTNATSHTITNVHKDMTISVTFKAKSVTPTEYEVSVNASYATNSGASDYTEGETVTINAGSRSGYSFNGWTVNSGDIILNNANSATTTFEMPDNDVTITANWTRNSGGNNGSDNDDDNDSGTTTPPEVKDPETSGGETNVDIETKPTTSGGTSKADIPDDTLEDAVKDALDEVKGTDNAPKVTVDVDTPSGADSVEVILDSTALEDLVENENAAFEIKSDVGTMTFDREALAAVVEAANGADITLVFRKVEDKTELTEEQRAVVGDAPLYELYIESGGKRISDFKGGSITVQVPEDLEINATSEVLVYYIDDDGNVEAVSASYNSTDNTVTFITKHFSHYVIQVVDKPNPSTGR